MWQSTAEQMQACLWHVAKAHQSVTAQIKIVVVPRAPMPSSSSQMWLPCAADAPLGDGHLRSLTPDAPPSQPVEDDDPTMATSEHDSQHTDDDESDTRQQRQLQADPSKTWQPIFEKEVPAILDECLARRSETASQHTESYAL